MHVDLFGFKVVLKIADQFSDLETYRNHRLYVTQLLQICILVLEGNWLDEEDEGAKRWKTEEEDKEGEFDSQLGHRKTITGQPGQVL
jgi:hypothetical protein